MHDPNCKTDEKHRHNVQMKCNRFERIKFKRGRNTLGVTFVRLNTSSTTESPIRRLLLNGLYCTRIHENTEHTAVTRAHTQHAFGLTLVCRTYQYAWRTQVFVFICSL